MQSKTCARYGECYNTSMNIEVINIAVPDQLAPQIKQLLQPYHNQLRQSGRALTPDQEWHEWQLRTSIEVLENLEKSS